MTFLKGRAPLVSWAFVAFLGIYSVLWYLGSVSLERIIQDTLSNFGHSGISASVGVVRYGGYPLRIGAVCHDLRLQKHDSGLDAIIPVVAFQTNLFFPFHQTIWAEVRGGATITTAYSFWKLVASRLSAQIKPILSEMTLEGASLTIANRKAVISSFPQMSVLIVKKDVWAFDIQGRTFVPRASGFSEAPLQFSFLGNIKENNSAPLDRFFNKYCIQFNKSNFVLDSHTIEFEGFIDIKGANIIKGDLNVGIPHEKCWPLLISNFLPKDSFGDFLTVVERVLWGKRNKKRKKTPVLPIRLRDGRVFIKNLPFISIPFHLGSDAS